MLLLQGTSTAVALFCCQCRWAYFEGSKCMARLEDRELQQQHCAAKCSVMAARVRWPVCPSSHPSLKFIMHSGVLVPNDHSLLQTQVPAPTQLSNVIGYPRHCWSHRLLCLILRPAGNGQLFRHMAGRNQCQQDRCPSLLCKLL